MSQQDKHTVHVRWKYFKNAKIVLSINGNNIVQFSMLACCSIHTQNDRFDVYH